MATHFKLLVVALTASFLLALGINTAAASHSLSISETRLTLTGRVTFAAELGEVICKVTFEKTVSRTIPKVRGILMGRITSIRTRECEAGGLLITVNTVIILNLASETLWRLFYDSFLGSLPEITGARIQIANTQVLLEFVGFDFKTYKCLYEGNIEGLATIERRIVRTLRHIEGANRTRLLIDLRGSGTCPPEGVFKAELIPTRNVTISLL